jgi:hypothetical protein
MKCERNRSACVRLSELDSIFFIRVTETMQQLKLLIFRSLQDSDMNFTLGSRRSSVREELRGVVVDGACDAPALDAVLVLAVS